jgi:type 1 glutamine amidotransferase
MCCFENQKSQICFQSSILFLLLLVADNPLFSQAFKILHYTETSGFDHQTRSMSYNMFQQLGAQNNFTADDDGTGNAFNTLSNLQQYSAIVFANTTGDAILDSAQRSNFEQYITAGGNVIGIHSASDTYRHSTANGTNTGMWDFYPELIGASVQQNPNHVSGTPFYNMHVQQVHPLVNGIPDPWYKAEEYYYWQFGYFDSLNNNILLKVDSTIGPNGMVNSYDSSRATAWYKVLPAGNRIFYTSLGHDISNYTTDSVFINFIRNAILWTSGAVTSNEKYNPDFDAAYCFPNSFREKLYIQINSARFSECYWQINNTQGESVVCSKSTDQKKFEINFRNLPDGIYFMNLIFDDQVIVKKIIKINAGN